MSDLWDGIDTVNESASSISQNVDYVSEREQYMVYSTKLEIRRNIESAQDLLDESPDYLYEDEYSFLESFVTVFKRSEHQGGYNVENEQYLKLFESALEAIQSRMTSERERLIREIDDEEGLEIQHMFYQIGELLSKIIEELDDNWTDLLHGRKNLSTDVKEFNQVLQYLVRGYRYENRLISGEDVDSTVVRSQITQLSSQWNEMFEGDALSHA